MDVSIIVPCYNSANTIDICANSILTQNYGELSWELIIVDDTLNNSSLDQYEEKENILVIRNDDNLGLASSRNVGIKNCTGNLLVFIDSDMELEHGWIKSAVNTMKDTSIMGLMGKYKLPKNAKPNDLDLYLYSTLRGADCDVNVPLCFRLFLFSNTVVRKVVLDSVGTFDENIKNYGGEDIELSLRIHQKFSNGIRFDRNLVCYHHDQKKVSEFCDNMEKYGKFNLSYIISKHPNFKSDFVPSWALSGLLSCLLFNSIITVFAKILLVIFPTKYIIRYMVIYSVIRGYRRKN